MDNPLHHLGQTRSALERNHLLLTPDTFVRTTVPGMTKAVAIIHVSPAIGAAFTQFTAEFEPNGQLGPTSAQRFLYLLEGSIELEVSGKQQALAPRGFAYIPEGLSHKVTAKAGSRVAVVEKPYQRLDSAAAPELIVSSEDAVASLALNNDPDLQVRCLLPDHPSYDFAVNTMSYQPGAALSMVEMHIMEHGLLMLEGGGIYRLGDSWYPTTAGDFIWMGPWCPQWFGAIGKKPAKYLIYKDWNRHPLRRADP
ncbi:MAG TPA: (S)-ureidoglycine aminohydrolase [Candidatus Solibacter sp.]|nr:(S)-ureidoglycine aminohydrolase [Candidatus Solibacter sp.]